MTDPPHIRFWILINTGRLDKQFSARTAASLVPALVLHPNAATEHARAR